MYLKAYGNSKDTKGLYLLVDPLSIKKRDMIIQAWNQTIADGAHSVLAPNLVPKQALTKSGHLAQFKDQLFKIEGKDLYLRPQTAQSIFTDLKVIKRLIKGFPLSISQIGRAYRNQRSTRDGQMRKCEFEQMQLHVLGPKGYSFLQIYLDRINKFFELLDLKPEWIEVTNRPHYSQRTIDFMIGKHQVGCLNYRGTHDLVSFSPKELQQYSLYEISLGLDRLISLTTINKLKI